MVKIHGRSTSASLETGFSIFQNDHDFSSLFFVRAYLCCPLTSTLPTPGWKGWRSWDSSQPPPAQRAAVALEGKHPLSRAAGGCSAQGNAGNAQWSHPPNPTCPPRLQPPRRNLLLPHHRLPQARHCSPVPVPEPRERSHPPCRSVLQHRSKKKELKN